MAVEIKIKQGGLIKKKIELKDILMPDMSYGISDYAHRLAPIYHRKNIRYAVVYFKDMLHRGFRVHIDKDSVTVSLPMPDSYAEIYRFYDYVNFLCQKLKAKSFLRDGIKFTAGDPENGIEEWVECINEDIAASERTLTSIYRKIDEDGGLYYLLGIYNPIALSKETLDDINCDPQKLGELMHSLQSTGFFYTAPIVRRAKDNSLYAFYTVYADMESVIPYKPFVLSPYNINVNNWYVRLIKVKGLHYFITFEDFINSVDKDKKYDSEHFVLSLTAEQIDALSKQHTTYKL